MRNGIIKERLHYIDIAKGILIIMVVWGHFELILRECYKESFPTVDFLDKAENFWTPFFMPAFFYITGFCSSFKKRFKEFLITGVKTLLLPAIIIYWTINIIEYLTWDVSYIWIFKTIVKELMTTFVGEWFIPSLFISRLIVWLLVRLDNNWLEFGIALILFTAGLALYNGFPEWEEIWYYKHGLIVTIFVWVGCFFKNHGERLKSVFGWWYLPVWLVILFSGTVLPYITNKIVASYWQIPEVLVLALSGTLMTLSVSKWININKLLEVLGRYSLIIYLAHFTFYRWYIGLFKDFLGNNTYLSVLLFLGIVIMNIASCCLLAWFMNLKYTKWMVGKF